MPRKRTSKSGANGTVAPTNPSANEIRFYRANERPFGVLSNLYACTVKFEGVAYPTAEHAYQAGKPSKKAVREWILAAPSPALLAMAAHGLYTWDIVPTWSKTKFDRMRKVLRAKFTQHRDLGALLLSTGDARLVEAGRTNNAVNRLWGEVNGKGKNMLGVLLMEIREELREGVLKESTLKARKPLKRSLTVVVPERERRRRTAA